MQDESESVSKPKRACRVYPPRIKKFRLSPASPDPHPGRVSEDESSCGRAPTPYNIDLPPCDLEVSVTGVSQTLLEDRLASPPQPFLTKVQCADFDTPMCISSKVTEDSTIDDAEVRNVATQTLHETVGVSDQNSKVALDIESGIDCSVSHDSKGDTGPPANKHKCQSHTSLSDPDVENSALIGDRKLNTQEEIFCYVQQKRLKPYKQEEEDFVSEKLKRPQHHIVGFLEDHAEFSSDWKEAVEGKGRYAPSVLESTVDGSVVKGARRSYGSRISPGDLDFFINAAIQNGSGDQDPLISLDEWGLKTEQHKYKCSQCEVVSRSRTDVEQHIATSRDSHSEAVVTVLLGSQARGRSCPVCNMRLQRTHFFKHIRNSHGALFPLRCGYCVFLGQDHNQLRHHIRKKHGTTKYRIIDIPRLLAEHDQPDDKSSMMDDMLGSDEEEVDDLSRMGSLLCPLCGKGLKTLANLKKHVIQHSRQKQRCVLCPFTTSLPTQVRSHYRRKHPSESPQWQTVLLEKGGGDALVDDVAPYLKLVTAKYGVRQPKKEGKWVRQYRCPHCDYTCNFNSSYNRHLRLHNGIKPYKCGYCDFHAREAYVIRKHCAKVHKGKKTVIENDKDFKAPYRYASRVKKEKYEWLDYNETEEEDFNHGATHDVLLPLQSGVKEESESVLSQIKDDTCRIHTDSKVRENESSLGNAVQSVSLGVDMNVCSSIRGTVSLCENLGREQYHTEMPRKISPKTQPKRIVKPSGESQKSTPRYLLQGSVPVKVKTFKLSHELRGRIGKKGGVKINRPDTCFRQLEIEPQNDDSLMSEKKLVTSSHPENEDICCSISVSVAEICDMNENTVVMHLGTVNSETLNLEKITYCTSSVEIQGSPAVVEKCSETSNPDPSESNVGNLGCLSEDVKGRTRDGATDTEATKRDSTCKDNAVLVKEPDVKQCEDQQVPHKLEPLVCVPTEGLENNLHTHIAFLTDSRVQRLSNRISATPGVMTRDLLDLDYSNNDYFCSEKVRLMMKKKKGGRVKCRECGTTTTYRAFYKHAKKHFNVKPFKCGYCSYRSIEKSKIRVHNTFCHPSNPCIILKLSPETAGINTSETKPSHENEFLLSGTEEDGKFETVQASSSESTLSVTDRNSLNSITDTFIPKRKRVYPNVNKSATQVNSLTAPSGGTLGGKVSAPHRQPPFQCPICFKCLQKHTPSIRRHLYSHYGYKPYKCGYCTFTGIGQSEVRAHHVTHGFTTPPKVEPSGIPMPLGLTPYVNDILTHHRGGRPPNKRKGQPCQQNVASQLKQAPSGETDLLWVEPETVSKEDLTAIYLTPQDNSQQGLVSCSQQGDLETLGVESCSLAQPLESEDLSSEAAYAVQVLESGHNASSPSTLPSQLDLSIGTESHSNCSSDSVCVVYLIE
ncbi:uncharacterized protein [Panulirus ornatus]|uniref:uncharacterized protein isoform X2 n=1 Tax=Panulirus ornatus TaxID=150431 RepID=UPI003A8A7D16